MSSHGTLPSWRQCLPIDKSVWQARPCQRAVQLVQRIIIDLYGRPGAMFSDCATRTISPEFWSIYSTPLAVAPFSNMVYLGLGHGYEIASIGSYGMRLPIHGPLTRYAKLRVAHAPGMPGTFSPSPQVSDRDMHHGTCVTHVPWCMPGSLTSGFVWSRWWGKRSRCMRNPQFYVSGKRPMPWLQRRFGEPPLNLVHGWVITIQYFTWMWLLIHALIWKS